MAKIIYYFLLKNLSYEYSFFVNFSILLYIPNNIFLKMNIECIAYLRHLDKNKLINIYK
jgi:hypothetical protein